MMLKILGASAVFLGIVAWFTLRTKENVTRSLGGKVIGITGRMGSGKTYMSVMIAHQHLMAGHDVRTNFTMKLADKFYEPRISTTGVWTDHGKRAAEHSEIAQWFHCLPRVSVPWEYFTGWDQFADLSNCVVTIDEAQLYAPSYKPLAFPLIARWKLAMARKFHLDVYWISQHEDRVNSTLKHLTNIIYVCNAWFGGKQFTAKGYEPEYVRRKGKHIARKSYKFQLSNAELYDTLEILTPDEHLGDEKQSAKLDKIEGLASAYNKRKLAGKKPQSREEIMGMMQETLIDAVLREPEPEPFSLPSEPDGRCIGLAPSGLRCGRPTGNENRLCDGCIQRAKDSLKSLQSLADDVRVSNNGND